MTLNGVIECWLDIPMARAHFEPKEKPSMKYLAILLAFTAHYRASAGEIFDFYHKNYMALQDTDKERMDELRQSSHVYSEGSTNYGITEIGIERTGCFGTCPAYTFIVKSDGTFRYHGEKYASHQGDHTGTVPPYELHNLLRFIKDSGYMSLLNTYEQIYTDAPDAFTMVVMNGQRKVINDAADGYGPSNLWAIEQLIDDLMAKADWSGPAQSPQKQPPPPISPH
jgi:hypothetical protein